MGAILSGARKITDGRATAYASTTAARVDPVLRWGAVTVDDRDIRFGHDRDIRFGHDLDEVQDEHGVDLALLRANLALSVEERLRALEECIRFAESVRPVARTRSEP